MKTTNSLLKGGRLLSLLLILLVQPLPLQAQDTKKEPSQVLTQNVQIFDGTTSKLSSATDVLIVGNVIQKIPGSTADSASSKAQVIDGAGRVLMPGSIDSHVHLSFAALPMTDLLNSRPDLDPER